MICVCCILYNYINHIYFCFCTRQVLFIKLRLSVCYFETRYVAKDGLELYIFISDCLLIPNLYASAFEVLELQINATIPGLFLSSWWKLKILVLFESTQHIDFYAHPTLPQHWPFLS